MAQNDSIVWGIEYGAHIPNTVFETTPSIMLTLEVQRYICICVFNSLEIARHYFTDRT